MSIAQIVLFTVFLANLAIGTSALCTNFRRVHNRAFSLYCATMAVWALSVFLVISSDSTREADFYIRFSSYAGTWILVSFQLLGVSILVRDISFLQLLHRSRWLIIAGLFFGVLALTPSFLREVHVPGPDFPNLAFPEPVYGPAFPVVNGYILLGLIATIGYFTRKLKSIQGTARAEMQFTLLGLSTCVAIALVTSLLLPLFGTGVQTEPLGPLGTVPMNLIILYGIATQRILSVSTVIQRFVAYSLLLVYLTLVYLATYTVLLAVTNFFGIQAPLLPHLTATLVVALCMIPSRGLLNRFSAALFINAPSLDVSAIARQARSAFATVGSTTHYLKRFNDFILSNRIDADSITIFLNSGEAYEAQPSENALEGAQPLSMDSSIVQQLGIQRVILSVDTLRRRRSTMQVRKTIEELKDLNAELAIGLYHREEMNGIVLFGRRRSGTIYSGTEQDTIQIACNQLGTAMENARLYSDLQDSKLYNELLVDNLVSGIIAVDAEGLVTVVNREAQRILSESSKDIVGSEIDSLPAPLQAALRSVLMDETGTRDDEQCLYEGTDEPIPIRLGSTAFRSHSGHLLGAILVVNDISHIKELEAQVRHSDRLASIGTLSAGMAHEIKNPLVTIKTFTQLLPERFDDPDFRNTFSELISQEVSRIDSIVNQLLHFSRPAKPLLTPMLLNPMLHDSLRLIGEQLRQHNVTLDSQVDAEEIFIMADRDLLSQALINFLLNAIQSMSSGGTLTVRTERRQHSKAGRSAEVDSELLLTIQDTGSGIEPDALSSIFDPFFTTKEEGTGLGLSVSHGIVQEHRGRIEVESTVNVGTIFSLYLPICSKEAAAV